MAKNNRSGNKSPFVQQSNKLKDELIIKEKFELTEKQKTILGLGLDTKNVKCLILDGKAGTAKTYLSILIALKLFNLRRASGLTYIRTSIQSKDGEIGFIPGIAEEKTAWMNEPLYEKLDELLTKPDIDKLEKEGYIKTLPSSMLRGLNLKNIVLMDECQNALLGTLETVLTRMSEHSLLILCGDSSGSQNDLGAKSGFKQISDLFNDEESKNNGIYHIMLDTEDIVRSKLVKFVVEKFGKLVKNNLTKNGNGNGH